MPLPASPPFFLYDLMGSSLKSADREREDSCLVYRWFHSICRQHLQVDSCSTTAPFWYILEGQQRREILQRTELQVMHVTVHFAQKKKKVQTCDYIPIDMPVVRDLEETWLKKQWKGNLGKRYVDRPSVNRQKYEDIYASCKCSPKGDLSRKRIKKLSG